MIKDVYWIPAQYRGIQYIAHPLFSVTIPFTN